MASKAAIVFGGKGALGSAICSHLLTNIKFDRVVSVDYTSNTDGATDNIILNNRTMMSARDKYNFIKAEVSKLKLAFDLISCCAGGFAMGHLRDDDVFDKIRAMDDVCLDPAVMATSLSFEVGVVRKGGLVILTGAHAAISSSSSSNNNMIAYGLAKSSTHFLASTVSTDPMYLENHIKIVAIAPAIIDTPANRQAAPGADPSQWTKPHEIALKYERLLTGAESFRSGSILGVQGSGETIMWSM